MLIEQQRVGRKHPNIVYVYRAYDDFTDVELVRPITSMSPLIVKKMQSVMEYLHELGIAYVDWKIDNIGIGVDGEVKLFDFDGSGIFNVNDSEVWVQKAPKFYMYRKVVDTMLQNGIKPCNIDRWAFSDGIMELDKLKHV
jgi:serine/threonine protein kinase